MVGARLISSKIRWILPKSIKETVDLPDFCKESVPQIQILCTFQARVTRTWRETRAPGEKPGAPARPRTRTRAPARPHTSAPAHQRTRAPARSQPARTPER